MKDPINTAVGRVREIHQRGQDLIRSLTEENQRLHDIIKEHRIRLLQCDLDPPLLHRQLNAVVDENARLRETLRDVRQRCEEAEESCTSLRERCQRMEYENNQLLNLYVASQSLHESEGFAETLRVILELAVNLIGTEDFDVCLCPGGDDALVTLTSVGTGREAGDRIAPDRITARAIETGMPQLNGQHQNGTGEPQALATIPLKSDGIVLGVIIIHSLLDHKRDFANVDHDLFALLGQHAASALLSAHARESEASRVRAVPELPVAALVDAAAHVPRLAC